MDSGSDIYKALLSYRSAATSPDIPSPGELLMNRRLRTILPESIKIRTHDFNKEEYQKRSKQYYNQHSRHLQQLAIGSSVRIRTGKA